MSAIQLGDDDDCLVRNCRRLSELTPLQQASVARQLLTSHNADALAAFAAAAPTLSVAPEQFITLANLAVAAVEAGHVAFLRAIFPCVYRSRTLAVSVAVSNNSECARVLVAHSAAAPLLYDELFVNIRLTNFDDDIYGQALRWYMQTFRCDGLVLSLAALRGEPMLQRLLGDAPFTPVDLDTIVADMLQYLTTCYQPHLGVLSDGVLALVRLLFQCPLLLTTKGLMYVRMARSIRRKAEIKYMKTVLAALRAMQYDIMALGNAQSSIWTNSVTRAALHHLLHVSGDAPAGAWPARQHQAALARRTWAPTLQRLAGVRTRTLTAALLATQRPSTCAALRLGRALVDAHRLVPVVN